MLINVLSVKGTQYLFHMTLPFQAETGRSPALFLAALNNIHSSQ